MNRIDECIGCKRVIVLKPDQLHADRRCPYCKAMDVRPISKPQQNSINLPTKEG